MSTFDAAWALWSAPFVVIGAAVILGCIAGCAVQELIERRRGGDQ